MIVAANNDRSSDDNFVIRVISVAGREWLTTRIDSVELERERERERERKKYGSEGHPVLARKGGKVHRRTRGIEETASSRSN